MLNGEETTLFKRGASGQPKKTSVSLHEPIHPVFLTLVSLLPLKIDLLNLKHRSNLSTLGHREHVGFRFYRFYRTTFVFRVIYTWRVCIRLLQAKRPTHIYEKNLS